MGRFWRVAGAAVVLIAVGAVLAPVVLERPTQQQAQHAEGRRRGGPGAQDPVPILAAEARRADVPVHLGAVGTARPAASVVVRPQVDGQIVEILFREGQAVKKGDVLARIDPTLYKAQLDQALAKKAQDEAQLENAKRDLERYSRLAETNAATKQQADTQRATVAQIEAQLKADQAAIDSARATLAYTEVKAPFDGRTGIRNLDEGTLVRAGDATGLVTLSQIQPIAVVFNVPQQQLARVASAASTGPLAVEAMDAEGARAVDRGTLEVIDNQVDPATGTVRLKASFPNRDLALWPGAFVNVRLLVETLRDVVVVPTAAVQRGPKGTFVYAVGDGTVSVRDVTVTHQDERQAVVGDGLSAGERVATTSFARLAEGTKVTVSDPAAAQPMPVAPSPGSPGEHKGHRRPAADGSADAGAAASPRAEATPARPATATP